MIGTFMTPFFQPLEKRGVLFSNGWKKQFVFFSHWINVFQRLEFRVSECMGLCFLFLLALLENAVI